MANTGTEGGENRRSVRLYVRPFHADTWDEATEVAHDEGVSLSEWVSRAVALRLELEAGRTSKRRADG